MVKRSLSPAQQPNKRVHSAQDEQQERDFATEASRTWYVLGKCALTLELIPVALKAFESSLRFVPDLPESLLGLATTLCTQKEPQRALDLLLAALQQHPRLNNDPAIWREIAGLHFSLKQYDQAYQAANRALGLVPNDPKILLISADAMSHLNPSHSHHLYHTILSMVTQRRTTPEECDIARHCHYKLGLMAMTDQNWKAAVSEFQAAVSFALQANVDAELLWCLLANVREKNGDIEGALAVCRDAIQVSGLTRRVSLMFGYLSLVSFNQHQEDPNNAINLLTPLTATNYDDEMDCLTWYLLGKAYSLADNPRQAYDAFQFSLRKGRDSSLPWLAVGSLYLKMGQLPDALAAYSQAARLLVDDGSLVSAMASASAWDGLACVYERCDDQAIDAADAYARAAACYRAANEMRAASQAEQRAHSLQAAARGEAPVPSLRPIPETPMTLLRDIVINAIQDSFDTEDEMSNENSKKFHHLPLPRGSLAGSTPTRTPTEKEVTKWPKQGSSQIPSAQLTPAVPMQRRFSQHRLSPVQATEPPPPLPPQSQPQAQHQMGQLSPMQAQQFAQPPRVLGSHLPGPSHIKQTVGPPVRPPVPMGYYPPGVVWR